MLVLNLLLGADFPGLAYFVSPVLTALLLGAGERGSSTPAARRAAAREAAS